MVGVGQPPRRAGAQVVAAMIARRLVAPATVALFLLLPGSALGHAAFLASSPTPGQRLEASPRAVTMTFTEPLNERLTRIELVPARGGAPIPMRVNPSGAKQVAAEPLAPLRRGAYRIRWHTVSTLDGHALQGTFSFGVRAAAVGGEHSLEESPLARGGALRVVARGVLYGSLLVFAGGLLLSALLRERTSGSWLVPPGADRILDAPAIERIRTAERTVIADAGLVAAGSGGIVAILDAADAAGGWTAAALRDYLLLNTAGFARILVVLLVLCAGLVWLVGARRVAAGVAALALGAIAISGHANSAEPRLASVVNDWVHLLAGSLWLGGIALIVAVWWPQLRRGGREVRGLAVRSLLPRFGTVALPAFVVVTVTGLASAVLELDRLSALWGTGYGLTLAAKSLVVAVIATCSYVHAKRLRPRLLAANPHPDERAERRHWRLLRSEPALGVAVALAAALLATFPLPPRQLGEASEAAAAAPPCDPCPLPAPRQDELAVAAQGGRHVVAAWIHRAGGQLAGELRLIDYRGRPVASGMSVAGATTRSCGRGCLRFRAPASEVLRIDVRDRGRRFPVELPAQWRRGGADRARRLLEKAQATMRHLDSVREIERVTSGPGTFARTDYKLQAPDRLAFRSSSGAQRRQIGDRSWLRTDDVDWQRQLAPGGAPFRMRSWFRWTPYAHAARLLAVEHGSAELALMDPGTPLWTRMTVELDTMRVRRTRMVTTGHFSTQRFRSFNRPVVIEPPARSAG